MSYDTFTNTEPGVLIITILISLAFTLAGYCAIPLLMAGVRKSPITAKKYRRNCYLANIAVFLLFAVINGNISSVAPYVLWTSVFAGVGVRKLQKRGMLEDAAAPAATQQNIASAQSGYAGASFEQTPQNRPRFCIECGARLAETDKFCQNCGTKV